MRNLLTVLALIMVSQSYSQIVLAQNVIVSDEVIEPSVGQVMPQQMAPNMMPGSVPVQAPAPIYVQSPQPRFGYAAPSSRYSIQEQPTTLVQDSPLSSSPAEQIRKKRQDAETQTEDTIVQALERARMDDEIRRRDKFNSAIGSGAEEESSRRPVVPQAEVPVVPAPVPVVQQVIPAQVIAVPSVVEPKEEDSSLVEDKVDIRSEIRSALQDLQPVPVEDPASYFISGQVGVGSYPGVSNVRGHVASGFTIGMVTPERIVAEGSFFYGTYELEDVYQYQYQNYSVNTFQGYNPYSRIVDMKQYNLGAAIKYQVLPGKFKPVVGGMASYTRRAMSENSVEFRTSDAFDVGLVTGADLQVTSNFAIGFDFRYLTNISYRGKNDGRNPFTYRPDLKEIETLDYYMGTLSGKLTF